jgi:tRNA pseudouridine32 synthase/23S rRNA pseudouridine746 synthase
VSKAIDYDRIRKTFPSVRWVFDIVPGEPVAPTCEEELTRRFPRIDVATWRDRFELGGIYVDGARAAAHTPIVAPCRLEYFEIVGEPREWIALYPKFSSDMVVWSDSDVAVVCKPAGLPTTPPRDQKRFCLEAYLQQHFGQTVHLPSRLDTGVSGLLLCSLSSRMNSALQRAFECRLISKRYVAEVSGAFLQQTCEVRAPLARDPRHPLLRRVVESGGEDAHTRLHHVRTYQRNGRSYSLVDVEPLTGRTHQIRVHLASLGHPIVGDPYYDGEEAAELRLLSRSLGFHHPFQQRRVDFELPLALTPAWLHAGESA